MVSAWGAAGPRVGESRPVGSLIGEDGHQSSHVRMDLQASNGKDGENNLFGSHLSIVRSCPSVASVHERRAGSCPAGGGETTGRGDGRPPNSGSLAIARIEIRELTKSRARLTMPQAALVAVPGPMPSNDRGVDSWIASPSQSGSPCWPSWPCSASRRGPAWRPPARCGCPTARRAGPGRSAVAPPGRRRRRPLIGWGCCPRSRCRRSLGSGPSLHARRPAVAREGPRPPRNLGSTAGADRAWRAWSASRRRWCCSPRRTGVSAGPTPFSRWSGRPTRPSTSAASAS